MNYNTEVSLINTNANSGTISLPLASSVPGRVLTFKDVLGTFGRNSLTLVCSGVDTFEDNGTTKVLQEQYGSIQIVASDTKWYILNGTQVNTIKVSTLNTNCISSISISTVNTTISTIQLLDNFNSTNSFYNRISSVLTQAVSTNFLYYNDYVIAGTRVGYSNILNTYFNNIQLLTPPQINSSLSLWLDASDPTSVVASSGNVTSWNDKSGNGVNFTVRYTSPTYVLNYLNDKNAIFIQGSNQGLINNANNFPSYTNSQLSFFCLMRNVIGGGITSLNSFQFFNLALTNRLTGNLGRLNATTNFFNLSINSTLNSGYNLLELIADSNGTGTIFANGTSYQTLAVNPPSFFPNDKLVLERDDNTSRAYYFEIISYRNALSFLERQQVEGYLMWKYGLQSNLPLNHRFRYFAP